MDVISNGNIEDARKRMDAKTQAPPAKRMRLNPRPATTTSRRPRQPQRDSVPTPSSAGSSTIEQKQPCQHVWQDTLDMQSGRVCNICGLYDPEHDLRDEIPDEKFAARSRIDYTNPVSQVRALTRHSSNVRGKFHSTEGLTSEDLRAIRTADALRGVEGKVARTLRLLGEPLSMTSAVIKGIFLPVRRKVIKAKKAYKAGDFTGEGEDLKHVITGSRSLARSGVRWGDAADSLATASIFAMLHSHGRPMPFSFIVDLMGLDLAYCRRKYHLICRCFPDRFSPLDLIDQQAYIGSLFKELRVFQSSPDTRSKHACSAALRKKLLSAQLGSAESVALRLASWLPPSIKYGSTLNSNNRFDPWSTALAIAGIALEAQGSITAKKDFFTLCVDLVKKYQYDGHGTVPQRCAIKSGELLALLKQRLSQTQTTLDVTHSDRRKHRARMARLDDANGKSSPGPTTAHLYRHLEELLSVPFEDNGDPTSAGTSSELPGQQPRFFFPPSEHSSKLVPAHADDEEEVIGYLDEEPGLMRYGVVDEDEDNDEEEDGDLYESDQEIDAFH